MARWRLERRARRHRLALAVLLAGMAGVAATAWALGAAAEHAWGGLARQAMGPERELLAGPLHWLLAMMTAVLALGALLAWPRGDIDRWARGSVGEVATAALLERLPSRRWVVLHDLRLPGSRANVDHLVVGPSGVWVVDTKAYRSPLKAGWRKVRVGGEPLSTSAVRWEAETVAALLGVAVRPLVAVHGTGLPRRGRRCGGVWVVPAGRAVRRLRRGWLMRPVMGPSEIEKVVRNASAALLPYVNDQAERSAGTEVRSN